MAVTMCHPPDIKKLDSAIVKKAVKCCANSARWFLNERLAANPNIMLNPAGALALSLVRNEPMPIEPYRGRYMVKSPEPFPYEDANAIATVVLRGVKPKEAWWPAFETWLKSFTRFYRKVEKFCSQSQKKAAQEQFLSENTWLLDWTKLWKKQKAAMVKASKKEISHAE